MHVAGQYNNCYTIHTFVDSKCVRYDFSGFIIYSCLNLATPPIKLCIEWGPRVEIELEIIEAER